MTLTVAFLIMALLHPVQPTVVTIFHQPDLANQSVPLAKPNIKDIKLGPEHLTIVKTWNYGGLND